MGILKGIGRYAIIAGAAGFAAVLCLTLYAGLQGTLSSESLDTIAKALNGQLVEPQPVQEKPARSRAEQYKADAVEETKRALKELQKQVELLTVELNEKRAKVTMLEGEASRLLKDVADRSDALTKARAAFEAERASFTTGLADAGFKKVVKTLEGMETEVRAQFIYGYSDDEAVRLLWALKDDMRAETLVEIDRLDRAQPVAGVEPRAQRFLKALAKPRTGTVASRTLTGTE
ncbi:MAG TPA: hypothetical protein VMY39_01055 [Planctomycetota bacterium]|nr:hypothetical protein [Planctomycetota bacterium]